MENIILSEDSIFSVAKKDLFGKVSEGEITSSHEFIRDGSKVLKSVIQDENFGNYLYEYSMVLKLLIKRELLIEMQRRIDHIDTFYR